jgi:TetR/AcrR family transcriptional regulator, mexJK operon transcriptional repressor
MPEFGRRFFESGPDKRRKILAPVLAEANRRGEFAIEDADSAAFQFFSLCTAEIQFKSLFGVKTSITDEEIEDRARIAVRTFMRAYAPADGQDTSAARA